MVGHDARDLSDPLAGAAVPASMRWDLRDRGQFESFFEFCFPRVLAMEMKRLGDRKRAEKGTESVLQRCAELAVQRDGEIRLVDVLSRLRAWRKACPAGDEPRQLGHGAAG